MINLIFVLAGAFMVVLAAVLGIFATGVAVAFGPVLAARLRAAAVSVENRIRRVSRTLIPALRAHRGDENGRQRADSAPAAEA